MLESVGDPSLPTRLLGLLLFGVAAALSARGHRRLQGLDANEGSHVKRRRKWVALTLLLTVALFGYIRLFDVPYAVVGIYPRSMAANPLLLVPDLFLGTFLGFGLYVIGSGLGVIVSRLGDEPDRTQLRASVPRSSTGWIELFVVSIPAIAVAEELLFRSTIGALYAGYGVSPWIFVVLTSVLFGFNHLYEGGAVAVSNGIVGGMLGAIFVLTGNVIVPIAAHYANSATLYLAIYQQPEELFDEVPPSLR